MVQVYLCIPVHLYYSADHCIPYMNTRRRPRLASQLFAHLLLHVIRYSIGAQVTSEQYNRNSRYKVSLRPAPFRFATSCIIEPKQHGEEVEMVVTGRKGPGGDSSGSSGVLVFVCHDTSTMSSHESMVRAMRR